MPRREALSTRQAARSRKPLAQYLQQPSFQDATKTGEAQHDDNKKRERHIRFDLSRNQFFFLPSKNQLKKQALAQADNMKPSLLFTAFDTRSIIKKECRQTQIDETDRVSPTLPESSDDSALDNAGQTPLSNNRITESLRNELEEIRVFENVLKRAALNVGTNHTGTLKNTKPNNVSVQRRQLPTSAVRKGCKSTALRDMETTATVTENTKSTPSKSPKSGSTEKDNIPTPNNDDEVSHEISSSELQSLLKYPGNSLSGDRCSRKSSLKGSHKSRYAKQRHDISPKKSGITACTDVVAVSTPI